MVLLFFFLGWANRWFKNICSLDINGTVGPPYAVFSIFPSSGPVQGGKRKKLLFFNDGWLMFEFFLTNFVVYLCCLPRLLLLFLFLVSFSFRLNRHHVHHYRSWFSQPTSESSFHRSVERRRTKKRTIHPFVH